MRRNDLLIAAAFLVEAQLEIAFLVPDDAPNRGFAMAIVTAVAAALAFRRHPAAWLAGGPLFLALNQLGLVYVDHLVSPLFAILFLFYGAARFSEWRVLAPVAVWSIGWMWVSQAIDHWDDNFGNYLMTAGFIAVGPILIGRVMRNRAWLNRTLGEKARRLERERAERAEAAAVEERERIAGELHDVVAHALSAMVVQAGAARRAAERDPGAAGEAFHAVETSGREALVEIRSLLGVLRREDEELALAPQPSLRHVGALVQRMRTAGLATDLAVEGEARELPIGLDLTAYRVVQEALGGALEHGGAGRANVRLRYGRDHVELVVDDDGGAPSRPLLGIRERVSLSGGQLQA
ncbi:MAG: sensor histidine kinase, partial [Solirubrobacteraceae bacterium]